MTEIAEVDLIDRLNALRGFLDERFHQELHWAMRNRAEDVPGIEAKLRILSAWPDPMGRWSAAEADAARAVKLSVYLLLALPYADHKDYDPSWLPAYRGEYAQEVEA